MDVVFYSTYLNHHQLALCQAFETLCSGRFHYIATSSISQERIKLGYKNMDYDYPFVIRAYENRENMQLAQKLAIESDVAIFGTTPESYIQLRMLVNKLSFRYCERIYKTGFGKILSPRGIYSIYNNHIKYRNKEMYMLCASAYTAFDYSIFGVYRHKAYKWGYFPEVKNIDLSECMSKKKKHKKVKILWVGRFIEWKHPELVVLLAEKLYKNRFEFEISMIGNGILQEKIRELISEKQLSESVFILGAMSPEKVREEMESSDIFILTSDFNEGWGAVLNEAMNSACAVVASHAAGSTPYLVDDGYNGIIYKNGDFDDLVNKVANLIDNTNLREQCSMNAYKTITELWNAQVAAERMLALSKSILNNRENNLFDEGPCSPAPVIRNQWYK